MFRLGFGVQLLIEDTFYELNDDKCYILINYSQDMEEDSSEEGSDDEGGPARMKQVMAAPPVQQPMAPPIQVSNQSLTFSLPEKF